MTTDKTTEITAEILRLKKEKDFLVLAHLYEDLSVQKIADFFGDSFELAKRAKASGAGNILFCGVRFMGETAKILSPEKTILMPTLNAECSLDLGCPIDEFTTFCDAHPDRTVVVYANTSAAVKARADWVVTSSIAVELIEHLDSLGEKIIWAPDRHLGNYVQKQTGADVLCWQGASIVHDEFKTQALARMKALYPDAAILVHPESPQPIVGMADAVGSTSQLINAARTLPHKQLIVATDRGIFYKMQQAVPEKELLEAPTAGEGATCRSCAHCPWMAMNGLKAIAEGLETGGAAHEIHVDAGLREGALIPLNRMLDFAATLRTSFTTPRGKDGFF